MNALALAKRRVALRRREDGAVMIIVAMTLAVLASVGIYALAAAATEVKTSGNERQNTQTHYLAQYGILGAAREISGSRALFTVKLMKSSTYQDTRCVSLQGVPTGTPAAACVRMGSTELNNNGWSQTFTNGVPSGSFGPAPMSGDFFVELTEPMQLADPARYSTNVGACFAQITATSIGFTQPGTGTPAAAAVLGAMGVETQRARLIAGPLIPCPK